MKSRIKKKMLHKEIDFSLIQVCGKKRKLQENGEREKSY